MENLMQSGLNEKKDNLKDHFKKIAPNRKKWLTRNKYYYRDLENFFKFNIAENASVLEVGCGTGELLASLCPRRGVGIDISQDMIDLAKSNYPQYTFLQMDAEQLVLEEKFDFVVISDTLGYFVDIQKFFKGLKKVTTQDTRIIITYHNFLWSPILQLAEMLKLKMPQIRLNWLNRDDIANLLYLEDYDIVKNSRRMLLPRYVPILSFLVNRYLAFLPFFNIFCLTNYMIVRPKYEKDAIKNIKTVTVVIPARNEKGNIEAAVLRTPQLGNHTEIIFIEGHSSDGTLAEIERVAQKYQNTHDIKYGVQSGRGKGDAVRMGFTMATGDVLMILDADLTMPPEDLPKFWQSIESGRGEFINGSRLVYPLEDESMRILNIFANKFFSLMFSWLLGQRLKDTLCGTKVISRVNYQKLIANRKYFGDFDPFGDFDLIFGAAKLNLKIVEVPIRYQARKYGSTQISRFRHGWLLLQMVFFAMNKIKFK